MARTATTADVFNAIAESRRRDILDALREGEVGVDELGRRLHLPQPQVSKHLKVLREVDLVRCRVVGRRRMYRVHASALRPLHDWVRAYEQMWSARYDRLDDLLVELQQEDDHDEPTR
jgi:DNA-binding transcriptional ArsR family regulator